MGHYTHRSLDLLGKKVRGVIEAENLQDARIRLAEKNLFPFKIKASESAGKFFVKPRLLLVWTEGLGQLVQAGIALHEALTLLQEQNEGPLRLLSQEILQSISSGQRLSEALKQHTHIFDKFYVAMIVAAEASGALPQALKSLSDLLRKKEQTKSKIAAAIGYPAFLLIFCSIATTVLLTAVVPALEDLIDVDKAPFITQVTFSLSQAVRLHGITIFAGIITAILSLFLLRKRLAPFFMRAPILRSFQQLADLERFSRLCSSLLNSGVGLFDALGLVKPALKTQKLTQVVSELEDNLVQGELISYSLEKQSRKVIPAFFVHMVAVGEKSADLGASFSRIADYYEEKLSAKLAKFISFLQPALLIFLAGIIAVVMLSILMPMTDISLIDS